MLRELDVSENAPWKQRFRAARVVITQTARAKPTQGVVSTNKDGMFQIYTWDVNSGALTQLTHEPAGKISCTLSPDGRYVYFLKDDMGNEIGHYVRVPYTGGEPQDITPELPPYSPVGFALSTIDGVIALVAACDSSFHLYIIRQDDSLDVPRLVYKSERFLSGCAVSHNGDLVAITSTERSGKLQGSVVVFDVASGEQIGELYDEGYDLYQVAFAPQPGDSRLLAMTSNSGFERPVVWNLRSGERIDIPLENLGGDVSPINWSPDCTSILLLQVYQAQHQLYVYNVEQKAAIKLNEHPGGTFVPWGLYYDPPTGDIFALWESSTQPRSVIALDAATGARKRTLLDAGAVPSGTPWRSVTFPVSDGQIIQGWLAVPDGEGPFPTILHTHGGPEWAMTDIFAASEQLWTDHGFAFLTINYRGSTTFGREFLEKIWYHPGKWEVEDMAAARDWLVEQKIAAPDSILLTGWSYGGFLTLHALGLRPNLWAGGMAGVAVADWVSQYDEESETMRGVDVAFFGGSPAEKRDAYVAASPITYVEHVEAPVLIIQGKNDTRCPAGQVERYEEKMKEHGKAIEVHWFDAGHGSYSVEETIQHFETMLRFAYRVLG